MTELTAPRRATVADGPPEVARNGPPGRLGEPPGATRAHLIKVLDDVAESIRAGRYTADHRGGVLVDTVVGGTRCLLLVHEPAVVVQLSPRESEIARMVASGRTNQAIAGSLDISVWTVSTHLRRIFAKLAVSSRAEMVAHLLEQHEISYLSGRRPE